MKVESCHTVSEYDSRFVCENAFDGTGNQWAMRGIGKGGWIVANFEGIVTKFSFKNRPYKTDYNRQIRLEFSDGSSESFKLASNHNVQSFTLKKPVETRFVKIVVEEEDTPNKNNGAAEIQFFGCTGSSSLTIKNKFKSGVTKDSYDLTDHDVVCQLWDSIKYSTSTPDAYKVKDVEMQNTGCPVTGGS